MGSVVRESPVQLRGLASTDMATIPRHRLGAVPFRAGLLKLIEISLSRPEFDLIKEKFAVLPKVSSCQARAREALCARYPTQRTHGPRNGCRVATACLSATPDTPSPEVRAFFTFNPRANSPSSNEQARSREQPLGVARIQNPSTLHRPTPRLKGSAYCSLVGDAGSFTELLRSHGYPYLWPIHLWP